MVVNLHIPRTHPRYFTLIPKGELVLYLAGLQKCIPRIKCDRTVNYEDGASVLFSLLPA